jgi:hypothetical protein
VIKISLILIPGSLMTQERQKIKNKNMIIVFPQLLIVGKEPDGIFNDIP